MWRFQRSSAAFTSSSRWSLREAACLATAVRPGPAVFRGIVSASFFLYATCVCKGACVGAEERRLERVRAVQAVGQQAVRRGLFTLHESLVQPSLLRFLFACMFVFMERLYLPAYVVSSSCGAIVWSNKDAANLAR